MVSRFGLEAADRPGWDTRIYRRIAGAGEHTHPVVHACTRPLPAERGDLGGGVIEVLGPEDVFVALVELGSELAGQGLFAPRGMPRLAPSQFGPDRLQRVVPGRSGAQHFFTDGERAFCLFVVLGSHARRMALVPRAAQVVTGLAVTDRATMLTRGPMP
jgi:hypothetical protein